MKFLFRSKAQTLAACVCIVVNAGMLTLTSLILIQFLNTVLAADYAGLVRISLYKLGAWGLYILTLYLRKVSIAKAIAKANLSLRSDISMLVANMPQHEFNAVDKGEYLSWYSNDVAQIEAKSFQSFFSIVGGSAQFIFSIIALFSMHWIIVVVSLILTVVMMSLPRMLKEKIGKAALVLSEKQGAFTGQMKDALMGLDVLRAYSLKDRFYSKTGTACTDVENAKVDFVKRQTACESVIDVTNIFCQLGSNITVAVLVIQGLVSAGVLFAAGNLVGAVFNSVNNTTQHLLSISGANALLKKFALPEYASQRLQQLKDMGAAITLQNVTFGYTDTKVLDNVSMRFERGKKYALVGPSGCGKTTVLKLLTKQIKDYEGSITYGDTELSQISDDSIYQTVAYIAQDTFLFNDTLKENITLGQTFSAPVLDAAIRQSALAGDMAQITDGLEAQVGENGKNLSGGQKQRVSIARALIHNRSILLVDEGTSALDKENADLIEQALLENNDLTLILISHHLSDAARAKFDRIYDFAG